jgi:enoyl-CoA hydratase/carnithine racemase
MTGMPPASDLQIQRHDGITTLTLARTERRNALDSGLYRALTEAICRAADDRETRVILITGGDYFCAGNDLAEFVGYRRSADFVPLRFLRQLAACRKPIVAAVEGGAIGVGATLLQHCDFVHAGRSTRFHLPFVQFGLCVEGGASVILAQGAMARQAARWLLLGEPFSAEEALSAGLVTSVTDDGCALEAAYDTARRLAGLPCGGVRATKLLIRQGRTQLLAAMEEEIKHFTDLLEGDAAQQALTSFLQRKQRTATAPPLS